MLITLKTISEIEKIRRAGKIITETFNMINEQSRIQPGLTTGELDRIIEQFIISRGGRPAFKGYRGFPKATCISVNAEVVHGIPSERKLEAADLIKIDIGVEYQGYYADAARTFYVGQLVEPAKKLYSVTHQALKLGIQAINVGAHLSDISHAIQAWVEENGFSVVRELGGHGIGSSLHEDPLVPNFGKPGTGPVLEPGMVLAIEPMVNVGRPEVYTEDNGWTVVTRDGSLSAHFEDTIVIRREGVTNLTNGANS